MPSQVLCWFIFLIIILHISNTYSSLLVTNLTHQNYFDGEKTISEIADINLERSLARASFLLRNESDESMVFHNDIESHVSAMDIGVGFVAHLEIGNQRINQRVVMDTASSLLWVNCEPCGTYVLAPLYNPSESYTFKLELCEDYNMCAFSGPVRISCLEKLCSYRIQYPRMVISGRLARETFKFKRSKDTLKNVVFGCTAAVKPGKNFKANGVLGLADYRFSLVSQRRASKFSYCIGDIYDTSYSHNRLLIGDELELMGATTPLITQGKYYITLETITVGDQLVPIDPLVFRRTTDYTGGMIVDSGSTHSYMPRAPLYRFREVLEDIFHWVLPRNYSVYHQGHERLCYNGLIRDIKAWFPETEFRFQDGATISVGPENLFEQYSERTFCLGFLPTEVISAERGNGISILGIFMQQHFYVVYDLAKKKISFLKMDCASLSKYVHDEL